MTLTFGEVCAGIGLEELALLIAKVQYENLLGNIHSVLALGLIAAQKEVQERKREIGISEDSIHDRAAPLTSR